MTAVRAGGILLSMDHDSQCLLVSHSLSPHVESFVAARELLAKVCETAVEHLKVAQTPSNYQSVRELIPLT